LVPRAYGTKLILSPAMYNIKYQRFNTVKIQ